MNNLEKQQSRDEYMAEFKELIDHIINQSNEEQSKKIIKLLYKQMVLANKNLIECGKRLKEYEENENLLIEALEKKNKHIDMLMGAILTKAKQHNHKIGTLIQRTTH